MSALLGGAHGNRNFYRGTLRGTHISRATRSRKAEEKR